MAPVTIPSHSFKVTNKTTDSIHLHGLNKIISIESNSTSDLLTKSIVEKVFVSPSSTSSLNNSVSSSVGSSSNEKVERASVGIEDEMHELVINLIPKFHRTRLVSTSASKAKKYWIFQTSSKKQQSERLIQHLIIYPSYDLSDWMSKLSNERLISELYLPGTHETLALHGYPISTCQSPLSTSINQLNSGLRFFDFRFSLINGELLGYHGIQNQFIKAIDVFNGLYEWLDSHKTEAVLISIKQENNTPGFEVAMWNLINANKSKWFIGSEFPTLGESRGKLILFSRFSNRLGYGGLQPLIWPNNNSKIWNTKVGKTDLIVQDWYSFGPFTQIPEKVALVLSLFRPSPISTPTTLPSTSPSSTPLINSSPIATTSEDDTVVSLVDTKGNLKLRLNFLSGAQFLTAFPFIVAKGFFWGWGLKGVNERVLSYLLSFDLGKTDSNEVDESGGGEGFGIESKKKEEGGMILLMDYFESPGGLVELMIGFNFK